MLLAVAHLDQALQLIIDVFSWTVFSALSVLVLTSRLTRSLNVFVAVGHDGLPVLLVGAWFSLTGAVVTALWAVAAGSLMLAAYQLVLLLTHHRRQTAPQWAATGERLTIATANVYAHNETPHVLAAELLGAHADLIVINEWTPAFGAALSAAGGDEAYPHRLVDPADASEYSVCIASHVPFAPGSGMERVGPMRVAHAIVRRPSGLVHVVGLHLAAVLEPGGNRRSRRQMRALQPYLMKPPRPLIVTGDFNMTSFRPEYRGLLRLGLRDAHDALGKGLSRSFRLAARGVLATVGAIARIDHALVGGDVHPLATRDLPPAGSDHHPFVLTVALRRR